MAEFLHIGHRAEDQIRKKFVFIMKWRVSGIWEVLVKSLFLGIISLGIKGKCAEGLEGVHGEGGIGKRNARGKRLLKFRDEKELCVENSWFYEKREAKSLIVRVDVKQKLILR